VFDFCSLMNKNCPFAGKVNKNTHCGLKYGSLYENNVAYMKSCPLKKRKK